jgi:uncharacterized phiE125 gp8 family phage protein
MRPIIEVITPPASEPFTVAQLLDHRKVHPQDVAKLESCAKAARVVIEKYTGRALLTQTLKLTRSSWPSSYFDCNRILLERTPLQSVTSVKYYPADGGAQSTLSNSEYLVISGGQDRPGWIELAEGANWPALAARSDAVEVTFVAGATSPAAVSHDAIHAIVVLANHYYDEASSVVNVGNIVTEIPEGYKTILSMLRVGGWFA